MFPPDSLGYFLTKACLSFPYGAEILASATADDKGYDVRQCLPSLTRNDAITHTMNVESKGLFDTLSTLHEGREYRFRQTGQQIRNSFDSGDLDELQWIEGRVNIADGFTKDNHETQKMLHRVTATGRLEFTNHKSHQLTGMDWN